MVGVVWIWGFWVDKVGSGRGYPMGVLGLKWWRRVCNKGSPRWKLVLLLCLDPGRMANVAFWSWLGSR